MESIVEQSMALLPVPMVLSWLRLAMTESWSFGILRHGRWFGLSSTPVRLDPLPSAPTRDSLLRQALTRRSSYGTRLTGEVSHLRDTRAWCGALPSAQTVDSSRRPG